MKNILNLTKIYFKQTITNLFNTRNTRSAKKSGILICLLFIAIISSLSFQIYQIGKTLNAIGYQSKILTIGLILNLVICIMLTIADSNGHLYKAKDFEQLSSLPIKYRHIVTSKVLSTYLTAVIYSCLVAIPSFIVYFIFNPVTFLGITFAILAILLIPAMSQLINSLLAWLINIISSKLPNKNIMRTILSIICTIGIGSIIYIANTNILSNMLTNGTPLWLKICFANIYFLSEAIVKNNVLAYFVFVLVSIGYIVLASLVISLGYKKINSQFLVTKTKNKHKPLTFNKASVNSSLIKKEFSTLFNSPAYCMNCIMGPIMCLITCLVCISIYGQIKYLDALSFNVMMPLIVFATIMCLGIAPTTSASINMEGSKFDNLKSLPISFNRIAFCKIVINVIISMPAAIVNSALFGILLNPSITMFLLVLAYQMLAVIGFSLTGFLFNLKYPKLKWNTETQASKQGASILFTSLINSLTCIVPIIMYYIVLHNVEQLSNLAFMAVVLVAQIIYTYILFLIFNKKGKKLFNKIN